MAAPYINNIQRPTDGEMEGTQQERRHREAMFPHRAGFLLLNVSAVRHRDAAMRILIATVTAGGGHLAAAAALEEAWTTFRPGDQVERVDMLRFFSPLHRKIHSDGYVKLVERAPEIWGMVFKTTDNPRAARRLKFSCALAVLSTATLVILIAAEPASV